MFVRNFATRCYQIHSSTAILSVLCVICAVEMASFCGYTRHIFCFQLSDTLSYDVETGMLKHIEMNDETYSPILMTKSVDKLNLELRLAQPPNR